MVKGFWYRTFGVRGTSHNWNSNTIKRKILMLANDYTHLPCPRHMGPYAHVLWGLHKDLHILYDLSCILCGSHNQRFPFAREWELLIRGSSLSSLMWVATEPSYSPSQGLTMISGRTTSGSPSSWQAAVSFHLGFCFVLAGRKKISICGTMGEERGERCKCIVFKNKKDQNLNI